MLSLVLDQAKVRGVGGREAREALWSKGFHRSEGMGVDRGVWV